MTRRILKFPVQPFMATEIVTADKPEFLSVAWQGDQLCVWVLATAGPGVASAVVGVPTGYGPPDDAVFVGTGHHPTLNDGGPLVIHVFRQAAP